jgi:hypothetical protein
MLNKRQELQKLPSPLMLQYSIHNVAGVIGPSHRETVYCTNLHKIFVASLLFRRMPTPQTPGNFSLIPSMFCGLEDI